MHLKSNDIGLDQAVTSMADLQRLLGEIVYSMGLADFAVRLAVACEGA